MEARRLPTPFSYAPTVILAHSECIGGSWGTTARWSRSVRAYDIVQVYVYTMTASHWLAELTSDIFNQYLHMAESTPHHCLGNFYKRIRDIISARYMRGPTTNDCGQLLRLHNARHHFPRMLGSIDCIHCILQHREAVHEQPQRLSPDDSVRGGRRLSPMDLTCIFRCLGSTCSTTLASSMTL